MTCLACDVLAGRIEPPGGAIYEEEGWVVDHSSGATYTSMSFLGTPEWSR